MVLGPDEASAAAPDRLDATFELAQSTRLADIVEAGKAGHRQWVRDAFAPFDGDEDLLVVATDVYTWKLLRRDRGHSRARTEALMTQLVRVLLTNRSQ